MQAKRSRENLYIGLLLPIVIGAFLWAVYNFPAHRMDWRLGLLTTITVFFSSLFRIQLPRTKIHVTTSDAAIILSFLWYGGEIAFILAVLEAAFTSLTYLRQGGTIRKKTILVNVINAGVAIFFTTAAIRWVFGPATAISESGDITRFIGLLTMMAFSLFLSHSTLVSLFMAAKNSGKSILNIWTEYCLNALVIYLTSAVLAGFTLKAFEQINVMLFAAVGTFFAVVYFTYRRYIDDIKKTAAKAEQSERERAEQAEIHVKELKHYVRKLEQSGEELRESHEKLRHAAFHDALTGLPNKNYFVDALRGLLKECRSQAGRPFAVLYLDLNRFKTINDSVGHSRGDRLIKQVAARLKDVVDEKHTVGRFSGDEFAILVSDLRNDRDVIDLACKVADSLSEPFTLFGREVFTSACVGIAFGSRSYKRAENILRDADIAMYHAKDSKKKYVVFDQQMHATAVNLLQLETDLRSAIERNEFELYYQPIVLLDSMALAGFEALIRWNHPQKGVVSPSEFIGISESTDLIVPLTLTILEDGCRQVGEWLRSDPDRNLFVSVNLSGKHFEHPQLVEHVQQILEATSFDPKKLKLEITETALMENAETSIAMVRRLKELGVKISIDDFGTGYSSLNYLHRFPIDTLKIDRSFVNSIERSAENSEIVRTIVYLAKALRLDVVAEGIESIRQLNQLQALGCEYGQGYLFSRPLPAQEIEGLLIEDFHWRGLLDSNHFGIPGSNELQDSEMRLLG
jgi:diguanylate cyclase (GGDEF)-like protein